MSLMSMPVHLRHASLLKVCNTKRADNRVFNASKMG
jgi:hypothetical protein